MSDNDLMPVDADEFEMINPDDLPSGGPIMPGGGITADALGQPGPATGQPVSVPHPLVEENNTEDIEDGLRSFLGGPSKPIHHPKRAQYQNQRQMVEESYDNDYDDDLEDEYERISTRPRGQQRQQQQGFTSASDLLRQFKRFMLSDVTDDPHFDVEDLKFALEDMMDMVELFAKQRARRTKKNRISRQNPIVRKALHDDVYDVLDDDDDGDSLYMPDL